MIEFFSELPLLVRALTILGVVLAAHVAVLLVRWLSRWLTGAQATAGIRKLRTVISLATSVVVFALYFLAIGFILRELGISMTAYLASASVIGLAVGFGSQSIVQDVVTGLTLIFSDLIEVGEMVNIGGQIGIVRAIGMRFTRLENSLGVMVSIPNRTIGNVMRYPRGYMRALVDVTLGEDPSLRGRMIEQVKALLPTVEEQFPGITRHPPSIEGYTRTSAGREFMRVKFRIWPDRVEPISQSFRQELLHGLRQLDPGYMDWMVTVNFEVEEARPASGRRPRGRDGKGQR
ncbi:MAG: mechanosensitive ion channel [Chromatiales bacterium]|nr:mechanosensitive ion channel [Chromatiales bacterium]